MYKETVLTSGLANSPIPTPQTEVRCAVRFPLELPVILEQGEEHLEATTRNLSSSGVLMQTPKAMRVGSSVRFSITMPRQVLGSSEDVLVRCTGRVVRCNAETSSYLTAVTLDEYIFQNEEKPSEA